MEQKKGSIDDVFVARFLAHEGETVEEAKERLRREQESTRRHAADQSKHQKNRRLRDEN